MGEPKKGDECDSNLVDFDDSIKLSILDKEGDFESPFKWSTSKHNKEKSDWMVRKYAEKLDTAVDDKNIFKWFRFAKLLVLIYEHTEREELYQALQYMKTCEEILLEPQNTFDPFYKSIEKALWHVFYATQLQLITDHHVDLQLDPAQLTRQITPVSKMQDDEQAGILGIKTCYLINFTSEIGGYIGTEVGHAMLATIQRAIELSPNQPEWYYKQGIILQRLRASTDRFSDSTSRSQQSQVYQKAYELDENNASYVLKYANQMKHLGFDMNPSLDEYKTHWNEVVRLFNKVLELRPECPYTVFQVAKSFNRFPKTFSQRNKAKELLLSAEKRAPKFYLLLHELGWLYTIILKDLHKGCTYYRQSFEEGFQGAAYSYLHTKLKIDPAFNPLPTLEKVRDSFLQCDRKVQSILQMGFYYFFVKDDVDTALEYFVQCLDEYSDSKLISEFKPYCIFVDRPVSLLEFLHNCLNKEHRTTPRRDEVLEKVYKMQPNLEKEPNCPSYWKEAKWAPIQLHYSVQKNNNTLQQHGRNSGQSCSGDSNWRERGRETNGVEERHSRGSNEQERRNDWATLREARNGENPTRRNDGDTQRQRNNSGRHRGNTSHAPEGSWRR